MLAMTESEQLATFAIVASSAVLLLLIWLLGGMPGRIAKQRGHHNAAAIRILGWCGVFTLGLLWAIALVWAYTTPAVVAIETSRQAIPPDRYRVMGLDYAGKKLIVRVSAPSAEEARSRASRKLAEVHKVEPLA